MKQMQTKREMQNDCPNQASKQRVRNGQQATDKKEDMVEENK